LNTHFNWRTVFIIAGAPCLLIALAIRIAMPEAPRGMSESRPTSHRPPPLLETLARLAKLRTFRYLALSAMTCAFVNYGLQIWAATFFIRVHGMNAKEVGMKLGIASAVGLFIGTIGSGTLADRFGRLDIRWYMRVTGAGMLLAMPFGLLALMNSTANASFVYYCAAVGFVSSWASPIHAMTQTITAARMRGMASAIIGFCLNLVGYGLGPLFVGVLNDHLRPTLGVESVRYSLMILLSGGLIAAWVSFSANRTIALDMIHSTH
jgi:MFS family permease